MNPAKDFGAFVAWLHAAIRANIAQQGYCKSYEGAITLSVSDVFQDPPRVVLTLAMYVIAPNGRKHEWFGDSVESCVAQAHADISRWIADEESER